VDGKLENAHEEERGKGEKQVNVQEGGKKEKGKRKTQPILVP